MMGKAVSDVEGGGGFYRSIPHLVDKNKQAESGLCDYCVNDVLTFMLKLDLETEHILRGFNGLYYLCVDGI